MDELVAIIIGVLSATVSCFLTAYLTYFFDMHRKKKDFNMRTKKDLLDKIDVCLNGIPYIFLTYGEVPLVQEKVLLARLDKKTETKNKTTRKDEVGFDLNSEIFCRLIFNSKDDINANFCEEYRRMSDTWILVMELRNFMRTAKTLASSYGKFEVFFNKNTETITPFMLAAKTDWVSEVKSELTEILRAMRGVDDFSDKQKAIIKFFASIKELHQTLVDIKEKVISEITY